MDGVISNRDLGWSRYLHHLPVLVLLAVVRLGTRKRTPAFSEGEASRCGYCSLPIRARFVTDPHFLPQLSHAGAAPVER